MADETYETLRKRISENLNTPKKELAKSVADISRNFGNLGLETAVWYPEMIHSANIGGIEADSYIGYSRIEGKWGLIIRTIERDQESRAFVGQRVFPIESCGNVEILVNALKKARELLRFIAKTREYQTEVLSKMDPEIEQLRSPECRF